MPISWAYQTTLKIARLFIVMIWNYAGSLADCGFLSTLLPISPLALAHSHLKEGKEKKLRHFKFIYMSFNIDTEAMSNITRGRQRPSPACDECRRRKLRCDGQQPQCGVCQETDTVCEVTPRGTRGPKKGHLKALKSRVEQLEALLESSLSAQEPDDLQIQNQNNTQSSSEGTVAASPVNVTRPVALNITEP